MIEKSVSTEKKPRKKTPDVKPGDILSFSSAIVAIVASAIFYYAGWVYVSHWYSFFGIDASQLDIATPLILVQGVPGIFTILITGLAVVSLFSVLKYVRKGQLTNIEDLPNIVLIAYILSFIILIVLGLLVYGWSIFYNSPIEASVSIVAVMILLFVIILFEKSVDIAAGTGLIFFRVKSIEIGFLPSYIKPARFFIWSKMMFSALASKDFRIALDIFLMNTEPIIEQLDTKEENFLQDAVRQQARIRSAMSQTSRFWLGALIILYFLVSISVSSILGEWDAMSGGKTMVGGWGGGAIYVFAKRNVVLALPIDVSLTTNDIIAYGPVILLGMNSDDYYFTDWTDKLPYKKNPNVYVVKIKDDTALGLNYYAHPPQPMDIPYIYSIPSLIPESTHTPDSTP